MTLDASFVARVGGFAVAASLVAGRGEVLAILGPNGSGKSTMLAALAGHLAPESGSISLDGRILDGDGVHIEPVRRRIGLLGQRPLLFPHLSVRENVAFGPRAQGVARAQARTDAATWLARVGLAEHADSRPSALSGGQQQRVALARRTAIVHDGSIVQHGATAEVLGHPRTPFVAALAGVNLVAGVGAVDGTVHADGIDWIGTGDHVSSGSDATVVFAPGSVRLRPLGDISRGPNTWNGTVATLEPLPGGMRLHTIEHPSLAVDLPSSVAVRAGVAPGIRLRFAVDPDDVSVRLSDKR